MKGDFSRFTHDPSKHYTGVLKQQGRVDFDADWNEYVEIQDHLRRAMETDLMGGTGVPDKAGGFYISWDTSNEELVVSADESADPSRPSRIYVDSILGELEATQVPFEKTNSSVVRVQNLVVDSRRFEEDQWIELIAEGSADTELVQIEDVNPATKELTLSSDVHDDFTHLRRGTTYSSQPHYPGPDALNPTPGRIDLVYLDVWQRHVTAIEDPDIREEALAGPDTTTRLQTVWQVKVRQNILNALPATCSPDALPDNWAPAELGGGQLSTGGSYRGSENRLYRVEIHDGGEAVEGGATFKWSRDNGTVVFPIIPIDEATSTPQKDKVRVSRLGRDQTLALRGGDWVEVGGDESELNGEAGLIANIQEDGIDRTRLELTLESDDVTPYAGERHPKVRRWDQTEAGNGSFDPDKGACEVEEGKWIELEDGVQIYFEPGNPDHEYVRGDYWTFAVRAATSRVEELTKAPPQGIRHHYCPLALVGWGGSAGSPTAEIRDCRIRFGSLSGQLATVESFFYLGGDGQEALPSKEVLQPLRVGLTKGGQPLDNRQIRFTVERGNGRLRKVDSGFVAPFNSVTVETQAGVAECAWELDTTTHGQRVRATVVDGSQAPVIFTATLSGWSVAGNSDTDPPNNFLGTTDNQPLSIKTNKVQRMLLTEGGNVGIGTGIGTPDKVAPGTTLDVYRDVGDDVGGLHLTTSGGRLLKIGVRADASNERAFIDYTRNGIGRSLILQMNGGNVGIGTTEPQDRLQIGSTLALHEGGHAVMAFGWAWNNGTPRVLRQGFPAEIRWVPSEGSPNEGSLRLGIDTLSRSPGQTPAPASLLTLSSKGNVGIGTTGLQAKLHVSSNEPQLRLDTVGNRATVQVAKSGALQWDFGVGRGPGDNDFWFGDFNLYRLVLQKGTGNVGIGTENPQRRLQIGEDVTGVGFSSSDASPNAGFVRWGDDTGWKLHFGRSRERDGTLNTGETGVVMTIQDNVGVGIRTTTPTFPLDVNGDAFKNFGGDRWSTLSDRRLKKRVQSLKGALDKLTQLRGVNFEWRKPEEQGNVTGPQIGLVAQEVEEVFPDWVDTNPSGYKILTIKGFDALAVEAFKELKAENEALKTKNRELEGRIEALEANVPASVEDK